MKEIKTRKTILGSAKILAKKKSPEKVLKTKK